MAGETNLSVLLKDMQPTLRDGRFVFCHVGDGDIGDYARLQPILMFQEEEGLGLIVERGRADQAGLSYKGVYAMITLNVHSSLEAVGFLAAITGALAAAGVSVNPVAAHFHDHLFILEDRVQDAMAVLAKVSAES